MAEEGFPLILVLDLLCHRVEAANQICGLRDDAEFLVVAPPLVIPEEPFAQGVHEANICAEAG